MTVLDELAPSIEEIQRQYRREGMADAVVRIVLSRRFPHVDANEWCRILGLTISDLKGAIARLHNETGRTVDVPSPTDKRAVPAPKRRNYRDHRGGLTPERRRELYFPCAYCGKDVMRGIPRQKHVMKYHPGEWEKRLQAELDEKYGDGSFCPDCGQRIKVTVTVERHDCCAHAARPT